jgi:hypothetical protein
MVGQSLWPKKGLRQALNYSTIALFTAVFRMNFNAFREKSGRRPGASVSSGFDTRIQAEK